MSPFNISFEYAGKYYSAKVYPYPDKYVNGYPTKFGLTLNGVYAGAVILENNTWHWSENYNSDNGFCECVGEVIIAWFE